MENIEMLIKGIGLNAQKLAAMSLDCVVTDVDQLTVAFAISNLAEIARTLSVAEKGENQYVAAHKALDIGWNPTLRETLVKEGYFREGLHGLLKLAETNSVAGSRLMPVFEEAVSIYKEIGVSKSLKRKLENYMKKKLDTDGFAISHLNEDGKVMVKTAEWVNKQLGDETVPKTDAS